MFFGYWKRRAKHLEAVIGRDRRDANRKAHEAGDAIRNAKAQLAAAELQLAAERQDNESLRRKLKSVQADADHARHCYEQCEIDRQALADERNDARRKLEQHDLDARRVFKQHDLDRQAIADERDAAVKQRDDATKGLEAVKAKLSAAIERACKAERDHHYAAMSLNIQTKWKEEAEAERDQWRETAEHASALVGRTFAACERFMSDLSKLREATDARTDAVDPEPGEAADQAGANHVPGCNGRGGCKGCIYLAADPESGEAAGQAGAEGRCGGPGCVYFGCVYLGSCLRREVQASPEAECRDPYHGGSPFGLPE